MLARRAATGLPWTRLSHDASAASSVFVTHVPKTWLRQQPQTPLQPQGPHSAPWAPGSAALPSAAGAGACLLWAANLVQPEVLAAARDLLLRTGSQSLQFDRNADSVDSSPTFEMLWCLKGEYCHAGLADIFRDTVEERLLPVLRSSKELHSCDAKELVLCEALVRVYSDGQRRVHPAHYDTDALVTAVLEVDLTPEGFEGLGFYVQPGAHVNSRISVPLAPGDVVAHSFDLQHGVEVTAGRRCSVIMWFTDSKATCLDKNRSWCEAAAEKGDADAQYVLAGQLDKSFTGQPASDGCKEDGVTNPRVLELLRASAAQGHFVAQNYLGFVLQRSAHTLRIAHPELSAQHAKEALEWYEASAAQGFHKAMVQLARHHAAQGDTTASLKWLTSAAEQRADPSVMHELGAHYLSANDTTKATEWMERSAQMGFPAAQLAMGRLEADPVAAEAWLLLASENGGSVEATVALATAHLQAGRLTAVLRLAVR